MRLLMISPSPYSIKTDIAPQIRANRRELRDLKIAVLTPDTNNSIMKIKTDAANAPQKNGVKLMLFLLCFGLFCFVCLTTASQRVILKLWKREYTRSAEVGWVLLYPAAERIYSARRGEEYTGLIGGSGSVCLRVYYTLSFLRCQ